MANSTQPKTDLESFYLKVSEELKLHNVAIDNSNSHEICGGKGRIQAGYRSSVLAKEDTLEIVYFQKNGMKVVISRRSNQGDYAYSTVEVNKKVIDTANLTPISPYELFGKVGEISDLLKNYK